jgi:CheY-like chemotaxis protein
METHNKILILDDEAEWLDVCREFLSQLPSRPEIHTAASGPRALAILDAEPHQLLICDLKMPRMDGLQVLAIVRRRFPDLRTVVLTGLQDEEFRSRAYALGVDLFWLKSDMQQNSQMFLDCIESLLGRSDEGFHSVQPRNLVDFVRLECLSRSSTVLHITSEKQVARLWIKNGELIDAEAEDKFGEEAFKRILKWKSGALENLPAETNRLRTIHKSVDALIEESIQAVGKADGTTPEEQDARQKLVEKIALLAYEGAEFVVPVPPKETDAIKSWGTQNGELYAQWVRQVQTASERIGEFLGLGPLTHAEGQNVESRVVLLPQNGKNFVVGWPSKTAGELFEPAKKIVEIWDS